MKSEDIPGLHPAEELDHLLHDAGPGLCEEDVARQWWALPAAALLPLAHGGSYRLVFAGRPGGSLGPDVRDAVLHPDAPCSTNLVGDVEFHLRAGDWFAHLHHEDARYNNVILHVVLILDDPAPTLRQDRVIIPTCSLYDLSPLSYAQRALSTATAWPCQRIVPHMSEMERSQMLLHAGLLRFEQKVHVFVELLHHASPQGSFNAYDACLIPALAEGLGYGRDRAFFRAAGYRLLGMVEHVPEPLGRKPDPSPLDARRLHVLSDLVKQWRISGAWHTLRATILQSAEHSGAEQAISALRAIFGDLGKARADILICNVVLPFAAAVALLEHDELLAGHTQALYTRYPGLPSNQITRAMAAQLQLDREPAGTCRQQGLHYIYQHSCREKRCAQCLAGKMDI